MPKQLELNLKLDGVIEPPIELDVDGYVEEKTGIQMIGKARKKYNGMWNVLANVGGSLCLIEVSIS